MCSGEFVYLTVTVARLTLQYTMRQIIRLVVIVVTGMYTCRHGWIQWYFEVALQEATIVAVVWCYRFRGHLLTSKWRRIARLVFPFENAQWQLRTLGGRAAPLKVWLLYRWLPAVWPISKGTLLLDRQSRRRALMCVSSSVRIPVGAEAQVMFSLRARK